MEMIYYTGRGLPPFLSSHALGSLQLCLPHFYASRFLFKKLSLPEYTSTKNNKTYLCIRDIMNNGSQIQGHSNFSLITVSIPENTQITLEQYMLFAKDAKTDYIISFAEEAGLQSGSKRAQRSAKSAVLALDECLKYEKASRIIGNIQGGKDIEARV